MSIFTPDLSDYEIDGAIALEHWEQIPDHKNGQPNPAKLRKFFARKIGAALANGVIELRTVTHDCRLETTEEICMEKDRERYERISSLIERRLDEARDEELEKNQKVRDARLAELAAKKRKRERLSKMRLYSSAQGAPSDDFDSILRAKQPHAISQQQALKRSEFEAVNREARITGTAREETGRKSRYQLSGIVGPEIPPQQLAKKRNKQAKLAEGGETAPAKPAKPSKPSKSRRIPTKEEKRLHNEATNERIAAVLADREKKNKK